MKLITTISICLFAVLCSASSAVAGPTSVSIVELISNPAKFQGKNVRIVGYLHIKFEDQAIYLTKRDADYLNGKNGLWVEFAKHVRRSPAHKSKAKPNSNAFFDCKMVMLEGTFNMKKRGHLGMWHATIENVRVIVEQTRWFDGKRKITKP